VSDAAPAAALVWCPFPDVDSARTAAATLLSEGLIACANIIPVIESHFVWEGKPDHASEAGMLCKTTADIMPLAIERLGALHPYDTPAIIGWRCDAAHPASLAWLAAQCRRPDAPTARKTGD
jgi:periplasmic divalent cation tolerance protein